MMLRTFMTVSHLIWRYYYSHFIKLSLTNIKVLAQGLGGSK